MPWEAPGDVGVFETDSYDEDYQFMLIRELEAEWDREDKFGDVEHFDPELDEPEADQDELCFAEISYAQQAEQYSALLDLDFYPDD